MGAPEVRIRVRESDNDALTHERIEEEIRAHRGRQRVRVETLQEIRTQQAELRGALDQELGELKKLFTRLQEPDAQTHWWSRLGQRLSGLFADEGTERQSVEQLLRTQYDTSLLRLRQARELAARLDTIRADLYDEIDQLNGRMIASVRGADECAEGLLGLQMDRDALQQRLQGALSRVEQRELQAQADALRRHMAELSTQLQLNETCDERLGRLKQSTELLAQTIANLESDIRRYVGAATEKLDLVANQIQAVGAAADASLVLIDLKRSLDTLTSSMNDATRFVTEVQGFFHPHVYGLVSEMELYDAETRAHLEVSHEFSQLSDERRIEEGLQLATQHEERRASR